MQHKDLLLAQQISILINNKIQKKIDSTIKLDDKLEKRYYGTDAISGLVNRASTTGVDGSKWTIMNTAINNGGSKTVV